MSRLYWYFLAILHLSSQGPLQAQVEGGKAFKKRVLAEWKSVLDGIKSARWEKKIEYHSGPDPNHLRVTAIDVIQRAFKRGSGSLLSGQNENLDGMKRQPGRHELRITNLQYTAELRQSKKGDGWVLSELKKDAKDLAERVDQEVHCPWMEVSNMQLNQCLKEESFSFTRIEELAEESKPHLLRAHFEYDASRGETADFVKSGFIDFDPTHCYRPMKYQFNMRSELYEGTVQGTLEYDNTKAEAIPVLTVLTTREETRSQRKGLIAAKEIQTFLDLKYNENVPDEEFRLSFYGLPEPQGVVWETGSRWWLWFILIGLFSIAVGAYLRQRVKRRRMTPRQESVASKARSQT
jgi:hypothetical protein